MIAPTSRLLFLVALLLTPLLGLGVAFPEDFSWTLLGLLVFSAVVITDALLARQRISDLRAELPEAVHLTKDKAAQLPLVLLQAKPVRRALTLGLPLPEGFEIKQEAQDILIESERSRVSVAVFPLERGLYSLKACYVSAQSALGFWSVRCRLDLASQLRVYPDLRRDLSDLSALFLNRATFGTHTRRQLGKGREFEKLREYQPGDSFEDIHWKATARRGFPVVKVFQIERTQEVYLIVDAARLSARREQGVPILERFIQSSLVLAQAAARQGDLFGLVTFSDRVHAFVRAGRGKPHYGTCRDLLSVLFSRTVTPDFGELCAALRQKLRQRALLIFLTSLDDPLVAESFLRGMDLLRKKHLVLVNMVRPSGAQPLFSAASEVSSPYDLYRGLAGHFLWNDLRELGQSLGRRGISLAQLDNEKMAVQLVSRYLEVKQRQLL